MRTYSPKAGEITRTWHVIDATDVVLGRLASQVAVLLRGKHKPEFTPHIDAGDYVVVVNAGKIRMSGVKMTDKFYFHHTGWIGGIKAIAARDLLATKPERIVETAIKGMLPKSKLGRKISGNLHVYAGTEHPHKAQNPVAMPTR